MNYKAIIFHPNGSVSYCINDGYRSIKAAPSGSMVYFIGHWGYWEKKRRWYKTDLTPVLDSDVPNEYKALILLMDY